MQREVFMTWRSLVVALAIAALTSIVFGSSGPRAGEQLKLAAGPGESPGASDTAPGEAPEASPSGGPGEEGPPEPQAQVKQPPSDAAPEQLKELKTPPDKEEKAETPPGAPEPAEGPNEEAAEPAGQPKHAAPGQKAGPPAPAIAEGGDPSGLPVPKDPVEQAAFHSFEKNCARCHQAGPLLKKARVQKNFGIVLELDKLADSSDLIVPGNPEASKLFKMVSNQEMPYDCYQEFDCKHEPTKEDIQAIYDWIKSVGDPRCADHKLIDEQAIVGEIAADLDHQQEHLRKGMRYITLSNLYNACAKDDDMELYRQAVVKLLNSLSRNPDVLELKTIDPEGTIIAFNLDDLNWTEADWNSIIAAYPYAMRPDSTAYDTVKTVTDTPLAWVRGDWFAFTASRPPLYYDLLKLPKTFAEFEKTENVDVKKDIDNFLVKRSGFAQSGVSKHNRLIERHLISTGYYWTSYDFKGDTDEQSLFLHPLGPDGENAFHPAGGETIFSLPNGFQAYYLNKASGERLDKGPTEIVLDDSQRDRAVTNAISCFGCHKTGMNRNRDEIRDRIVNDRSFSADVRKQVEALYPPVEEMNKILEQDAKHYQAALEAAGLHPGLDTDGPLESINALSRHYENDVRQYMAAADFGLERDALKARLSDIGGKFVAVKRQLEQGHLPRGQFEPEFKEMISLVSDNLPIDVGAGEGQAATPQVAKVADTGELTLISDRSDYKVNDLPVFTIKSKTDCHLTLVSVDASGSGTALMPNDFQKDNFLPAGKEVRFPSADAPFQFRLKDPGTEEVIAVCNASGKDVDGIVHDFKTRQFTELGNYREFLTRQIVIEGAKKSAEGQKAKETGSAAKVEAVAKSDTPSRTAIKLQVK
jgi:hypothetical protein